MSFPTVGSGAINVDSDDDDDNVRPPSTTSAASPSRPSWSVFQRKPRPLPAQSEVITPIESEPVVSGGITDDYYRDDDEGEVYGRKEAIVAAAAGGVGTAAVPMSHTMEEIIHGGNDIYDATDVLNQLEEDGNANIPMNDTLLEEYEAAGMTTAAAAVSANPKEEALSSSTDPMMMTSSSSGIIRYLRQLFVLMYYKNISLLLRQPIYLLILVLSNTVSVLLR